MSGAFTKPLGRAPLLALSVLPYVTDYFGFVLKTETYVPAHASQFEFSDYVK
jgi:hypothetical protein